MSETGNGNHNENAEIWQTSKCQEIQKCKVNSLLFDKFVMIIHFGHPSRFIFCSLFILSSFVDLFFCSRVEKKRANFMTYITLIYVGGVCFFLFILHQKSLKILYFHYLTPSSKPTLGHFTKRDVYWNWKKQQQKQKFQFKIFQFYFCHVRWVKIFVVVIFISSTI